MGTGVLILITMSREQREKLEKKLVEQGRTLTCLDSRNRPGHPPDWKLTFPDGKEEHFTAFSYESALAGAVMRRD